MEDELEMGMFSGEDFQLNLEGDPSSFEEYLGNDGDDTADDADDTAALPADDENITPSGEEDDEDSGDSSQDEDLEDEGDDLDSDATSPNLYSSFATVLTEKGLLPSLDLDKTKIEDIDTLAEALRSEIASQARQSLIGQI